MGLKKLFSFSTTQSMPDAKASVVHENQPPRPGLLHKSSRSKHTTSSINKVFSTPRRHSSKRHSSAAPYEEQPKNQPVELPASDNCYESFDAPLACIKQNLSDTIQSSILQPTTVFEPPVNWPLVTPPSALSFKLEPSQKRAGADSTIPSVNGATAVVDKALASSSHPPIYGNQDMPKIEKYHQRANTVTFCKTNKTVRSISVLAHVFSFTYAYGHLQAANKAMKVYQRQKRVVDTAYRGAVDGRQRSIFILERLDRYLSRLSHDPKNRDLTLMFDGTHTLVTHLGALECNWIARFKAARSILALAERRLLSGEDYDVIMSRLFPAGNGRLYNREYFDVYLLGFAEEAIMSHKQAEHIAALKVTQE